MSEPKAAAREHAYHTPGVVNLRGEDLFRTDNNLCVWVGDRVIEVEWSIRAQDRLVLTRRQARHLAKTILLALDTTDNDGMGEP